MKQPWSLNTVKECVYTILNGDGELIAMIRDDVSNEDRVKSIATMLTASPQLYQASKRALGVLFATGLDKQHIELYNELKEAIAKAEGSI